MKKTTSLKLTALFTGTLLSGIAHAEFPNGLWNVQQYDLQYKTDVGGIFTCFYSDGTFNMGYTPPYDTWTGNWQQKDKVVLIRGKTQDDANYNAYSLVAKKRFKRMEGYGQSWPIGGIAGGYYVTTTWTFVSDSCN